MSDQQFDAVLTATDPEPRTRIRVNHSRTQRDGWQYETTVEVQYTGGSFDADAEATERLTDLLEQARTIGAYERDARNAESGASS